LGQQGPLLLSQVAGAGATAAAAAASGYDSYVITQEDVLLQLMEDADDAAAATDAVLPVSVALKNDTRRQRWDLTSQQQQQQPNLQRPPPAEQQQQQQGEDGADAADSSAPLITMLEVLVVWPLLAQHRLTTLACWQLLLQVRTETLAVCLQPGTAIGSWLLYLLLSLVSAHSFKLH
jgi:hypothetical protein